MGGSKKRRPSKSGHSAAIDKILTELNLLINNETLWNPTSPTLPKTLKTLETHLNKLTTLQDPKLPIPPRTPETLNTFTTWLTHNQIPYPTLPFHIHLPPHNPNNLTLLTKTPIPKHTPLFKIPKNLILSTETAKHPTSPLSNFLTSNPVFNLAPSLNLALHLLSLALNPNTFHYPYIQTLPSSFTIPIFYTTSQLLTIKPSSIFPRTLKIIQNHIRHYCNLHKLIKRNPQHCQNLPLNSFTYKNFTWAIGVVMTRQNNIDVSGIRSVMSLVPLWDLCNHEQGDYVMTTGYDMGSGMVECCAMKDFGVGDVVSIFYGERSSEDLFLFSGFVTEGNRFDYVRVVCGCGELVRGELGMLKVRVLGKKDVEVFEEGGRVCVGGRVRWGGCVEEVLGVGRVLMADKVGLLEIMREEGLPKGSRDPQRERMALEFVKESVEEARGMYRLSEGTNNDNNADYLPVIKQLHRSEIVLLDQAIQVINEKLAAIND